ncbi:hypothetical protein IB241_15725 [Pseudomonas sp. PDM05]|uniref:hypothetical protein n=1 Tax=Pseudomonas sp. PDM05 TaxID=2769301 RepID=UPI00177EEEBC|nr:hypothetical protein [Pseudomonas sp. PDM05]MBD9459132.1 hypothetical protein [Pseudomonas sp. PDM05]
MLTYEMQGAIVQLSDAANRARDSGGCALADKLTAEAEKLLKLGAGVTFEEWIAPRNYNLERYEGAYVSKITQEFHECWVAAGGQAVA